MMKSWKFFANILKTNYSCYASITGALLCFLSGMSFGWSSPELVKYKNAENNPLGNPITDEENNLIGSLFSIGGAIGPILFIYTLDYFGRKFTMALIASIFPIFHLVLAFAGQVYLVYISRIALGMAVGGSFSITAVYVGEIALPKLRGTYMSLGTSFILAGCFFSYCVGPYTSIRTFNIIIAVISFLYFPIFVFTCPESLYFTMKKYGPEKTIEILRKLRWNGDIYHELSDIELTVRNQENGSIMDIFTEKKGRKAFFLCTILLIIQQFCGITVLITYSQTIFKKSNVTIAPELATIIVSFFQTLTCLVTPFALKKYGRKPLLCLSLFGLAISNLVLSLYFYIDFLNQFHWLPVVFLVIFVCCYNCGSGPIPWIFLGEYYPLKVKSVGSSATNTIYWLFQFLLTYFYSNLSLGTSFLIFSVVCFFGLFFTKFCIIETKGKTFQDIQVELDE